MQCAFELVLHEVLGWNQYACVSYAKPAVERINIEMFNN